MENKDVFYVLEEKLISESRRLKTVRELFYGTANPADLGPTDNYGVKIFQRFLNQRKRFTPRQIRLSHSYFSRDYFKSINASYWHIEQIILDVDEKDELKLKTSLKEARRLFNRARFDVEYARIICSNTNGLNRTPPYSKVIHYEELCAELKRIGREIWIIDEFPTTYHEIISLDKDLEIAVEEAKATDEYDDAIIIRDAIHNFSTANQDREFLSWLERQILDIDIIPVFL